MTLQMGKLKMRETSCHSKSRQVKLSLYYQCQGLGFPRQGSFPFYSIPVWNHFILPSFLCLGLSLQRQYFTYAFIYSKQVHYAISVICPALLPVSCLYSGKGARHLLRASRAERQCPQCLGALVLQIHMGIGFLTF